MEVSRGSLHSQFFADLQALESKRYTETLQDPDKSFMAFLDQSFQATPFYAVNSETRKGVRHPLSTPRFANLQHYVQELGEKNGFNGAEMPGDKVNLRIIQGIDSHLKQPYLDLKDTVQGLFVASILAATHKPADFDPRTALQKKPKERPDQKIFRCAMLALNTYTSKLRLLPAEVEIKTRIEHNPPIIEMLLDSSLAATPTCSYHNKVAAMHLGKTFIARLLDEKLLAAEVREDIKAHMILQGVGQPKPAEPEVEATLEPPTVETQWTILPQGSLDELEAAAQEAEQAGSQLGLSETSKPAFQPERLRALGQLAVDWGEEAYIAVSDLHTSGRQRYRVAVLPEQLPNGRIIEHAIAENPMSQNALYAFRGETGTDPITGQVVRTWKEVFDKSRNDALKLGAKRFHHNHTIGDRVLEYLTRDSKELPVAAGPPDRAGPGPTSSSSSA